MWEVSTEKSFPTVRGISFGDSFCGSPKLPCHWWASRPQGHRSEMCQVKINFMSAQQRVCPPCLLGV